MALTWVGWPTPPRRPPATHHRCRCGRAPTRSRGLPSPVAVNAVAHPADLPQQLDVDVEQLAWPRSLIAADGGRGATEAGGGQRPRGARCLLRWSGQPQPARSPPPSIAARQDAGPPLRGAPACDGKWLPAPSAHRPSQRRPVPDTTRATCGRSGTHPEGLGRLRHRPALLIDALHDQRSRFGVVLALGGTLIRLPGL